MKVRVTKIEGLAANGQPFTLTFEPHAWLDVPDVPVGCAGRPGTVSGEAV